MNAATWLPPRFLDETAKIDLWNKLVGLAQTGLPLAAERVAAGFALVDAPDGGEEQYHIANSLIDGRLVFEQFPFKAIAGIDLTVADIASLAPTLKEALVDGMIDILSAVMPEPFGGWRRRSDDAKSAPAATQWFRIMIQGLTPDPVLMRIGTDRDALISALQSTALSSQPKGKGLARLVTVTPTVTLMRGLFTARDLAGIQPGAFLLLDQSATTQLNLRLGTRLWTLTPAESGWQVRAAGPVSGVALPLSSEEEGTSDVSDSDDSSPTVPQLRLPVDFDIGQIEVSLADLDAWTTGSVIPLNPVKPGDGLEVTIRIQGADIGSGEIVRVEDRLAIRITRLAVPKS